MDMCDIVQYTYIKGILRAFRVDGKCVHVLFFFFFFFFHNIPHQFTLQVEQALPLNFVFVRFDPENETRFRNYINTYILLKCEHTKTEKKYSTKLIHNNIIFNTVGRQENYNNNKKEKKICDFFLLLFYAQRTRIKR